MPNKQMRDLLSDIDAENINSSSVEELMAQYNISSEELASHDDAFVKTLESAQQQLKKNRLKSARAKLEKVKGAQSSSSVKHYVASKGKSALDLLMELMTSGTLPFDLTVANRDGLSITESDAEAMLADLLALGVIDIDD